MRSSVALALCVVMLLGLAEAGSAGLAGLAESTCHPLWPLTRPFLMRHIDSDGYFSHKVIVLPFKQGRELEKALLTSDYPALILVHSPSCPHSVAFLPIYHTLAAAFPYLRVIAVQADEHVETVPVIHYLGRHLDTHLQFQSSYHGNRSFESVAAFVTRHSGQVPFESISVLPEDLPDGHFDLRTLSDDRLIASSSFVIVATVILLLVWKRPAL
ncbi:hypothetical protein CAOG_00800 [Capsaspora owczarzaki ATCC 30864]|uniref:Thioredoxin domain-containing protein n=1 Tax=Capsaspora owczarzaki (strain ATCC 30864) TaxID=595528 RepID=A0A0D2WHW4_CAPO3|nr:hypothetical protein CAOG_00800 [Capsaspora owczarzaki ATCC 30864]KJE89300.1 hypothetical protein CAOG_000800 [Capsaspora owczarzaki ATCC 30864]|eukprot:XP_004365671.1 hypothetical protein CAOG_00800 [Capsaspora owczarzaki ATCC 30864]